MAETKRGTETQKKLEGLVEPLCARLGFELVLLQYQRGKSHSIVRLFVDRAENHPEGGHVTIDDCAEVSREVSELFDAEDPIAENYELEVSSPGIDRPLSKARDFTRFAGEKVKVQTEAPIGGRRNFAGLLRGMDGDDVVLEIDGHAHRIPLASIARANIEYQFK